MDNQITQKILSLIDSFQQSIIPGSQETISIMLQTTRIDAILNLTIGFITLALFLSGFLGWKFLKRHKVKCEDCDYGGLLEFFGWIILIYQSITLISCVAFLFNAYNWIGAFSPKIYLAHQIIMKITSN